MEYQVLINIGAGSCLAVMGWFARQLWEAVQELRSDLSRLREELPKVYTPKNDFKDGISELKHMLETINSKLDRKVERS